MCLIDLAIEDKDLKMIEMWFYICFITSLIFNWAIREARRKQRTALRAYSRFVRLSAVGQL